MKLTTVPPGLNHSFPTFCDATKAPTPGGSCANQEAALFEEGPGRLSRHAIHSAGRLALFRARANGLVVMRDLGGWPGVLGESHLAAAADLLDDPCPCWPLLDLPPTLLHGALIPVTGGSICSATPSSSTGARPRPAPASSI